MPQTTLLEISTLHHEVPPATAIDDLGSGGFNFESGCRPVNQSVDDKEQESK